MNFFRKKADLTVAHHTLNLFSKSLNRTVKVSVLLPPNYRQENKKYPVLFLNDGQDIPRLQLEATLADLYAQQAIPGLIIAAPHANHDRVQEYGTASRADFAGRGSKAAQHTAFIIQELWPYFHREYRILTGPEHTFCAGFSLGGLSALDMVWEHPTVFSKAGVFSGSFWWRSKGLDDGYVEATDRIMHAIVREGEYRPGQAFWFQAGTLDETADRNNNGIIDAIDDTLGLIEELEKKGFQQGSEVTYYEVEGGKHDPETWGRVMPVFLRWLFS